MDFSPSLNKFFWRYKFFINSYLKNLLLPEMLTLTSVLMCIVVFSRIFSSCFSTRAWHSMSFSKKHPAHSQQKPLQFSDLECCSCQIPLCYMGKAFLGFDFTWNLRNTFRSCLGVKDVNCFQSEEAGVFKGL